MAQAHWADNEAASAMSAERAARRELVESTTAYEQALQIAARLNVTPMRTDPRLAIVTTTAILARHMGEPLFRAAAISPSSFSSRSSPRSGKEAISGSPSNSCRQSRIRSQGPQARSRNS